MQRYLVSFIVLTLCFGCAPSSVGQTTEACAVEGYLDCLGAKVESFRTLVEDKAQTDFVLKVFVEACRIPDADGCFMLGSLLEGGESAMAPLAPEVRAIIPRDLVAAGKAYSKSCTLGSAMGCATYGQFLAGADEEFKSIGLQRQEQVLGAQRRSCELGMLVSCDVFLELARHIHGEVWAAGAYALHDQERVVAGIACRAGDPEGCFSEGLALIMMGATEDGSDQEIEAGWGVIRDNCAAGHQASCDLVAQYDK